MRKTPLFDRWVDKVLFGDGCWEWTACKDRWGYGKIGVDGKPQLAHRVVWELFRGPIQEGGEVMHACDNPGCVRPSHLRVGTHVDNMADREVKGRGNQPHGEANGESKLTEEQALAIRADSRPQDIIATEYGVSPSTVSKIKLGNSWTYLDGPIANVDHKRKLSDGDYRAICSDNRLQREIARDYGISQAHVSHIKRSAKLADLFCYASSGDY